ncbi:geranylgeranyl transferase type-2 subunit alpha [Aegotheles albertisi]
MHRAKARPNKMAALLVPPYIPSCTARPRFNTRRGDKMAARIGRVPPSAPPSRPQPLPVPPSSSQFPQHGRLKCRPPDAARRRQREEKLRRYRESMDQLGEGAGPGALALAGAVLGLNPDVGTCWNLRRRLLGALGGTGRVAEELALVRGCLGVNPKSYGTWHHRRWVLARAPPPPPTSAERELCAALLGADPRNFHAWEHRRALVAEGDLEAELDFAAALLARDFSNFSAWHHRGALLELELVRSAVYTDPHDQSAWVYLRCLLSRAPPPPRILSVYVARDDATLAVTFSRPVLVGEGLPVLSATLDGSELGGPWSTGEGRPRPRHTWLCPFPVAPPPASPRLHFRVTWERDPAPRALTLLPGENEAWWQEPIRAQELLWPEVGGAEPEVLREMAGNCRELLELEPESRGALLTLVLVLSALDPVAHGEEMRRCLRALGAADPLRGGFVSDVASRVEVALGLLGEGTGPNWESRLCLPGKALTCLPLLERAALVTTLELPRNHLGTLPPSLGSLRRLRVLDLSHNELRTLRGFPPLPRLEELRLHGNPLSSASALAPLAACPRLARLRLAGTPLGSAPDAAAHVTELLPHVDVALS